MLLIILLLAIGLILLAYGGNIFVDSSVWLAEKSGIPKVIVGATVVSLATTMPEMIVSFVAAGEGKVDIAIGNAIGSTTVNTGFIMALTLVFMTIVIKRESIVRKVFLMLFSLTIIQITGIFGSLGFIPSMVLLLCFVLFMTDNVVSGYKSLKREPEVTMMEQAVSVPIDSAAAAEVTLPKEIMINVFKFLLGAFFIFAGSQLLVNNGSTLASSLGVSERVIGVSIIAIGTSLPELVTAVTAIIKKQSDLSIGNIIGANIVNLAFVQPVCALISGKALPISENFTRIDIPVCIVIGCVAFIPTVIKQKFYKSQGVLLICLYIGYLAYTINA